MELFNLGKVPWKQSQLLYHALAKLGRESLVLLSPSSPYVCLGYHQDLESEVDQEYCAENGIPLFRREVGGGAVYLDGEQYFYQLIISPDNPAIPVSRELFFKKFLDPIIGTYQRLGIEAVHKPVNDVLANGRKIAGTGVGEIGECIVFVGNIIMDFNFLAMSKVLKAPDEKFRDHVYKTMSENMTTIRRELGIKKADLIDEKRVNSLLTEKFGQIIGPFSIGVMDQEIRDKIAELDRRMSKKDWLNMRGRKKINREVQIRSGLILKESSHKATGGLMRAHLEINEGIIKSVSLSGDFFCYPSNFIEELESFLVGKNVSGLGEILPEFLKNSQVEIPGIELDDWLELLMT